MEKILTQDFKIIKVPKLTGTEKQIKFGDSIRRKYIDIFNRKLNQYNIFDTKNRDEFTKKFADFLNLKETSKSVYWIENHCPICGSSLSADKHCINEYCSFKKE